MELKFVKLVTGKKVTTSMTLHYLPSPQVTVTGNKKQLLFIPELCLTFDKFDLTRKLYNLNLNSDLGLFLQVLCNIKAWESRINLFQSARPLQRTVTDIKLPVDLESWLPQTESRMDPHYCHLDNGWYVLLQNQTQLGVSYWKPQFVQIFVLTVNTWYKEERTLSVEFIHDYWNFKAVFMITSLHV